MSLSWNIMSIEALPCDIHGYNDILLDRIADMSLGDLLFIYRALMNRLDAMVPQRPKAYLMIFLPSSYRYRYTSK